MVSILFIGNQLFSQNAEIIKEGPISYTKMEKLKLSNGQEYTIVENPSFDENNKIYKKEIKKVFENLYPDAPNYIQVYIDTWKKYSKLNNMRSISSLCTFHAGQSADDYYNYFKNYDLMYKFMKPHFIYFDNNNLDDKSWELFKKEVRNPQVEIMSKELKVALANQKSQDLKENEALAKFVKGIYNYTSAVVKNMIKIWQTPTTEEDRKRWRDEACAKCEIDWDKSEMPKDDKDWIGLKRKVSGFIIMKNNSLREYSFDYNDGKYIMNGGFLNSDKKEFENFSDLLNEFIKQCKEKNCN